VSGVFSEHIPVGAVPCCAAFGAGALWVPNLGDGTLSRIDPATNEVVAVIEIGASPSNPFQGAGPASMLAAFADGAVWVTKYRAEATTAIERALLKLDPATNAVVETITLDVTPGGLVAGDPGSLWLLGTRDDTILRIDTKAAVIAQRIAIESPGALALGDGSLWVQLTGEHSPIRRVDPETGEVTATIDGIEAGFLAFTAGMLWATAPGEGVVYGIDPATHAVAQRVALTVPVLVEATADTLWVFDVGDSAIIRIDPSTAEVTGRWLGSEGMSIVPTDSVVWAPDGINNEVLRIDL
jgi:YVTN family beta-propeller protein